MIFFMNCSMTVELHTAGLCADFLCVVSVHVPKLLDAQSVNLWTLEPINIEHASHLWRQWLKKHQFLCHI
jgi:hypothetical protein